MVTRMTQDLLNDKRIKYLSILLLIGGLLLAGWFGYKWYVDRYEQAAYKDLSESIDGYNKVLSNPSPEKWVDVEQAFEVGSKRHSKSVLYPYFLAFEADALIHQNKKEQAITVMNDMLGRLSNKQPLYYLYAIKRALIKVDSADTNVQQEGEKELAALSSDASNPIRDMALYHAGLDAWHKGDKIKAEKLWKDILGLGNPNSNWYQLAQAKLRFEA